jgi:hypothetical protein
MRSKSHVPIATSARDWRLLLALMIVVSMSFALVGCDEDVTNIDDDPPAVPTGVFTVTGDGVVSVYWHDLYVLDLAGYGVYRHDGDDPIDGAYYWLGDVAWDENYDDLTLLHWFDDYDVENGETYYYAVLAFDDSGNESFLSFETVVDTPRPEGSLLYLYDRLGAFPGNSGFDFSRLGSGNVSWDDIGADIFVEYVDGVPFAVTARPGHVKIQDYGTVHWDDATYAPEFGYSEVGRVELIEGHCYFVKIIENPDTNVHYAKFQVYDVTDDYVDVDWAYQTDNFNPELKATTGGASGRAVGDEIVRF